VTYLLLPSGPDGCRLLVKALMSHSRRILGWRLRQVAMPWLDLVMMRKQLLTLGHLARDPRPREQVYMSGSRQDRGLVAVSE
jgi:hypothetical protein